MPTVLRSGPYRLFCYAGDGAEPPHVHIERDWTSLPAADTEISPGCTPEQEVIHGREATAAHPRVQVGGDPPPRRDRPRAQIARELGIHESLLKRWKAQLEGRPRTEAFPGIGTLSAAEEEIRRLRRELEQARQENAFLK